jgi:hypothetical protein
MSADANLGRFVIAAPGFSKASASEGGVIRGGTLEKIGAAAPAARPRCWKGRRLSSSRRGTGQPKGVVVRHEGLLWELQLAAQHQ